MYIYIYMYIYMYMYIKGHNLVIYGVWKMKPHINSM